MESLEERQDALAKPLAGAVDDVCIHFSLPFLFIILLQEEAEEQLMQLLQADVDAELADVAVPSGPCLPIINNSLY